MNSSLDTNILLRYILNDIPSQRKVAFSLINDVSQSFFVSDFVTSEVIYNLQVRNISRKDIITILYKIFEKKNIMTSNFVLDTVLPFYAEHPKLSFVDCYAAFEAERKGCEPLWTFDRKLAAQHPSAKMA